MTFNELLSRVREEGGFFVKREPLTLGTVKDFQKSQATHIAWIKNRLKTEFAQKKWHHSLQGRDFHRKLGRFNATHIFIPKSGILNRDQTKTTTQLRNNESFDSLLDKIKSC